MHLTESIYRDMRQWYVWEKTPTMILISDRLEREFFEFAHSMSGRSSVSLYNAKNMRQPTIFGVPVVFCDLGDDTHKVVSDNPAPRDKEWRGAYSVVWVEDTPVCNEGIN